MKYLTLVFFGFLVASSLSSQSSTINKVSTKQVPAPTALAILNVTWNGTQSVQIVFDGLLGEVKDVTNSFSAHETKQIELQAGEIYYVTVKFSASEYYESSTEIRPESGRAYSTIEVQNNKQVSCTYETEIIYRDRIRRDSIAATKHSKFLAVDTIENSNRYLLKKNKVKSKTTMTTIDKIKYKGSYETYNSEGMVTEHWDWDVEGKLIGHKQYTFDDLGRYDVENDLINNTMVRYFYDSYGFVVKKAGSGPTEVLHRSEDGMLIKDVKTDGQTVTTVTFSFDASGKCTGGTFSAKDNSNSEVSSGQILFNSDEVTNTQTMTFVSDNSGGPSNKIILATRYDTLGLEISSTMTVEAGDFSSTSNSTYSYTYF